MKSTGDPENARRVNIALILDHLRRKDLSSRAEIARTLSLSKMTVSAIVRGLIEEGIITERGRGKATDNGGRKPILLTLNSHAHLVIGIDVGTANTVLAIGNLKGETLAKKRVPTSRDRSPDKVVAQVADLAETLVAEAGVDSESILGAGLSIAGLVDREKGTIELSPDMGWRNVEIRELLGRALRRRLVMDNCTRVMTLGERWYGRAREVRNLFYINIGHGIGSAIVIDGQIYDRNCEIGHVAVTSREVVCECGNVGCLEAVASGQALQREAEKLLTPSLGESISVENLAAMARGGDRVATGVFRTSAKYLGRGMAIAANLYNPEVIVVGGGVALAGDLIMSSAVIEYEKHVLPIVRETTRIELSSLGMDAGVMGAIAMALNSFVFHDEYIARLH